MKHLFSKIFQNKIFSLAIVLLLAAIVAPVSLAIASVLFIVGIVLHIIAFNKSEDFDDERDAVFATISYNKDVQNI